MFSEWRILQEASCTNTGERVHACKCGATETEIIEKTSHTATTTPTIEPTCATEGKTEGLICAVCGEVLLAPNAIPTLPHTEVIDPAVPVSCSQEGLTEGTHCSVCNQVVVAQVSLGRLAHTEVVDPAIAVTCTENGRAEGKHCSVCNEVIVAQEIIPAKGHAEVIHPGQVATCTSIGLSEGKGCSVCGEVLVAQETITASHDEKFGICQSCNKVTDDTAAAKHYITVDTEVAESKVCTCYYEDSMYVRYAVNDIQHSVYVGNAYNGDVAVTVTFDIDLDDIAAGPYYEGRGFITYLVMLEDITVRSGYTSVLYGKASITCVIPYSKLFTSTIYLNIGNYYL